MSAVDRVKGLPLPILHQIRVREEWESLRKRKALRVSKRLRLLHSRKRNGNGSGDLAYAAPTDEASLSAFKGFFDDLALASRFSGLTFLSACYMSRSRIVGTSWR